MAKKQNTQRTNKGTNAKSITVSNRPSRNLMHLDVQLNTRATTTRNKKRLIPRKQKNNRIDF